MSLFLFFICFQANLITHLYKVFWMPVGDHRDTLKNSEYLRFLVQRVSQESKITPFRFNLYIQNAVDYSIESQLIHYCLKSVAMDS